MNPTKTAAIAMYLKAKSHLDLAKLYNHDMEVQVNVARGNGKKVDAGNFKGREWRAWTDGEATWKPFRIPLNAKTEPHYEDSIMSFSLEHHAEGIGMTGWDWKNKLSRWVAFDFDAIIGHSDKHGKKLNDQELAKIQETVANVPFVTLRRSTSGKGLHLYIFLAPIATANHTEHAALARSILSMLSGLTTFDFASKVDVCGGNMWVWHRKMYDKEGKQNDGLKLIKSGDLLTQVPENWRDHHNVITRKSKKSVPSFLPRETDTMFEELIGQRTQINLDCEHQALVDWLANNNCTWWWDQDNHMLVTHTAHLKDAHSALKFRGSFETIATGSEKGNDHNVFCFPIRNGAWALRRYSPGTKEHDTWEQNGQDWTRCYFNREPDLATVVRLNDGIEHEKGGYCFRHAESVVKVMVALGLTCDLPNFLMSRKAMIKPNLKENKLVIHIDSEDSDDGTKMKGWLNERKLWKRVFRINLPHTPESDKNENYDDLIRHLVSVNSQDAGWVLNRDQSWTEEPLVHMKAALSCMNHDNKEITAIIGSSVLKAWQIVNKPFQPEYPGNREWNRNAAQFAISPTLDVDDLTYPTWTRILNHCGAGLDHAIVGNTWCQNVGITTGAEFLMIWIAALFKKPDQPSTYLAFWGPQDSGKSIFHEMISEILVTAGVVRADVALENEQGFNGELLSAILCTVEETDLQKNKRAYNRIKDWVTSPNLLIHPKHGTPYMAQNYTHWIQCSNEQANCPIFPGDTRITLIYVDNLKPDEMVPKPELMQMLRKEAPDFLAALLQMDIPDSQDRLCVPTISTDGKKRAEEKNMTLLEQFFIEKNPQVIFEIPGQCVSLEAFHEKFILWMDDSERSRWSKHRVSKEIPERYPRGRLANNQHIHIGNVTFDSTLPESVPYSAVNLYLKQV